MIRNVLVCVGLIVLMNYLSASATVFVRSRFQEKPDVIYFPPSGDFNLRCFSSKPSNIVLVAQQPDGTDGTTYTPGSSLNITEVSSTEIWLFVPSYDFKSYTILTRTRSFFCQATSLSDATVIKSTVFTIKPGNAPLFVNQFQKKEAIEGHQMKLSCDLLPKLHPEPYVVWLFINNTSNETVEVSDTYVEKKQNTLSLRMEINRYWNGAFLCWGNNTFGEAFSKPIRVAVKYFGRIITAISPSESEVILKQPTLIKILADCYPDPKKFALRRYNQQNFLSVSNGDARMLEYNFSASRNDTGIYLAEVTHELGNFNRTFNLTILSSPADVELIFVNRTRTSLFFHYRVGFNGNKALENLTLCCMKSSTPDQSDVACLSSRNFSLSTQLLTGNITASMLAPNTGYNCQLKARNGIGEATKSDVKFCMTGPMAPEEPKVDCSSVNETILNVSWSGSNGGADILLYNVSYKKSGSEIETTITRSSRHEGFASSGNGYVLLSNLTKESMYAVEVTAVNKEGISKPGRSMKGDCFTEYDSSKAIMFSSVTIIGIVVSFVVVSLVVIVIIVFVRRNQWKGTATFPPEAG